MLQACGDGVWMLHDSFSEDVCGNQLVACALMALDEEDLLTSGGHTGLFVVRTHLSADAQGVRGAQVHIDSRSDHRIN